MKKIVIIGGGFAGVFTAKNLLKSLSKFERKTTQIELINEYNYFVFQPLLPEVSSGVISPSDAVSPLRILIPKIKHRLASVKYIDKANNTIQVLQGRHKKLINIVYDELVVACGQKSELNLTGFAEHSFTMKNLSDAFLLRNHILKCLELADVTLDASVKKTALTFVTAGAGFSGVETLGELQDMVKRALKYYPNINLTEVRFILLQKGKRILEQLPTSLAKYAHQKMQKRGIDIRLGVGVSSASSEYVKTDLGEQINTNTIITTIGSGALDFVKDNFDLQYGKIQVNDYMQVKGSNNIWALGDGALIPLANPKNTMQYAPPTAQFAVREAKILAKNLCAKFRQKPLRVFDFKPLGLMASLGAYQGVVQFGRFRISGMLAWFLWRGLYITKVPGSIAKIRITLNWMMDYIFPRTLVQISPVTRNPLKYLYFSKGDVICKPDEVMNCFYLIVSGSVILKNKNEEKILKNQEYFSDDISENHMNCTYQINALEDTRLLSLPKAQFLTLRQDFQKFDEIFKQNNTQYTG
jgi:NADH dehydrogenase